MNPLSYIIIFAACFHTPTGPTQCVAGTGPVFFVSADACEVHRQVQEAWLEYRVAENGGTLDATQVTCLPVPYKGVAH